MVFAEGCDYSSTANANWAALAAALVANGKRFAGRYAVYDKSPDGRGITGDEYRTLATHGIDVFLYYEETERWMLGGETAGVRAATRALDNIRQAGMPEGMPVYYSHDIDPEPGDFAAIDDCLRGAASVVGIERVGFYGGWLGIDHVMYADTARWFCQTLAWQYGRGLHLGIHLHQYGFNQFFAGTNCDLVAAIQPHYGQASDFLAHPTTTTTTTAAPHPPKPPKLPKGMSASLANRLFNPHKLGYPPTGKIAEWHRGGRASEAWLAHVLASNPHGKTWKDYEWPGVESITERGDGRIVWQFSDGFVFEYGAKQ